MLDEKAAAPAEQASSSSDSISSHEPQIEKSSKTLSLIWRKFYHAITYVPPNCRWDPENPPGFSMGLNVLFAFAGAFTVANLYYSHPILNILADTFHVPDEKVSEIPTVQQAGYAVGLLFLCPLADIFPRRPFTLSLVLFTATLWIGLCVTNSLAVFTGISFIISITTVTPQLMLPLVGELAPANRKATSLSIVVAGFIMGILIARLLSGTLTNFVTWRAIYWFSLGMQYLVFALMWLFMPDYPRTNTGIGYFKLLFSILTMLTKHPVLVQACLISICMSATFTSYWTTLTFLLAGAPYFYSPVVIGLFALLGMVPFFMSPLFARFITDRFIPHFSVILGDIIGLIGICIGTYAGTHTVAGPIIQAMLNDAGMQIAQVANRSAIYAVEPKGRNRINTAFMVATFLGQLMGTAAGNHIYAEGGWIASGSTSVGFSVLALIFCALRGPNETGWIGWGGGWSFTKPREEGPIAPGAPEVEVDIEKGSLKEMTNTEKALEEIAEEDEIENDESKEEEHDRSRDLEKSDLSIEKA
ncbi:MFS general substrate transporter [Rhizodiscina lignyota]|uniref:MFS general substrate transporter n=1 Tax=Rhizodiscina lignyota TaxID=1504668 RepID=A0A9P4M412_9PEZI|nr:MFS general substrate transporter [Rhizodiscina lignyota]